MAGAARRGRPGILFPPEGKRRTALEHWFDTGIERLVCLPWDASSALEWASLLADIRKRGTAMPLNASMIAASASRHQFTVATRNVDDFKKAGILLPVVDPFG